MMIPADQKPRAKISIFGQFSLHCHKKSAHQAHFGAVNGTRTRDPRLGKPMLYQLSYYRRKKKKGQQLLNSDRSFFTNHSPSASR